MQEMHIPVLRFPGGTDTDFIDWCDLVDNVPGRDAARPATSVGSRGGLITNRFGYDEFLQLCEEQQIRPLLVVNFQDGLLRRKPLADAARHAAELVAYCNAMVDDPRLTAAMRAWPAARAKNGRTAPYHISLFQIGNETWFTWEPMKKLGMTRKQAVDWYVTCLAAYVDAMRAVDPAIEIIADGTPVNELLPAIKAKLGNKIDYIVPEHTYWPFGVYTRMTRYGWPIDASKLSAEEIWKCWVGVPAIDAASGMSVLQDQYYAPVRAAGYKIAITEWN
jgi:alpha-N-arabinofuranosidase